MSDVLKRYDKECLSLEEEIGNGGMSYLEVDGKCKF